MSEVIIPGKFFKYRCRSVPFGAFGGHQVIKSGTENRRFSVPLLKVGRNSPSLPYRYLGPYRRIYIRKLKFGTALNFTCEIGGCRRIQYIHARSRTWKAHNKHRRTF